MPTDLPYRRRERNEVDGVAHFLTFSCFQQRSPFANDAIKARFVSRLDQVAGVRLLAWVVMPEHVHIVLMREESVAMRDVLMAIKRPFALEVLNRWRALAWPGLDSLRDEKGYHFWLEGGGYDRLVQGQKLREKIGYLHANPCRRALVTRSIDYRWSSAAAFEGLPYEGPPIAFDLIPPGFGSLT